MSANRVIESTQMLIEHLRGCTYVASLGTRRPQPTANPQSATKGAGRVCVQLAQRSGGAGGIFRVLGHAATAQADDNTSTPLRSTAIATVAHSVPLNR
jgi:hypothetical protein